MADHSPPPTADHGDQRLPRSLAVRVFLAFACAYFFSSILRGIAATLSPTLTAQFALTAGDLGLLAGGYFLGFSLMQLPLGAWLDAHGPRRVIVPLLALGAAGCALFALAQGFVTLLAARVLMGMGVAACLMAPLTGYRRWFDTHLQLRANAWMLMTGSLGLLASTLPVQWMLPHLGWRWLFWGVASGLLLGMWLIVRTTPPWRGAAPAGEAPADVAAPAASVGDGYAVIWRHPFFRRAVPLGSITYGGMIAVQTLWAGPWLTQVSGRSAQQAALGLFIINAAMLCSFWAWGWLIPRLGRTPGAPPITRRVVQWVAWFMPLSHLALVALVLGGAYWQGWAVLWLALFCALSTSASHVQSSVGLSFAPHLAGRALSAFNLAIFGGVFVVQWAIGLGVDGLQALGCTPAQALRGAVAGYILVSLACWWHFVRGADAARQPPGPQLPQ